MDFHFLQDHPFVVWGGTVWTGVAFLAKATLELAWAQGNQRLFGVAIVVVVTSMTCFTIGLNIGLWSLGWIQFGFLFAIWHIGLVILLGAYVRIWTKLEWWKLVIGGYKSTHFYGGYIGEEGHSSEFFSV